MIFHALLHTVRNHDQSVEKKEISYKGVIMKSLGSFFSVVTGLFLFVGSGQFTYGVRASDLSPDIHVFEGTIQTMIHCDIDGSVEEHDFLVLRNGHEIWLEMIYPSPEARVANTSDGKTVPVPDVFGEVKVAGTLVDHQINVRRVDIVSTGIQPFGSTTIGLGEKSVAAVCIGFSGNPFTFDKDDVWEAIFGEGQSMKSFYKEASFGGFTVVGIENPEGDVLGPFNLSYSGCDAAGGYTNAAAAARDAARDAGHPIDEYDKVLHIFTLNGQGCPGGGVGGGNYANIFVDLRGMWDYGTHEVGHTLGLGHASSSKNCSSRSGDVITYGGSCEHDEYGDMTDIMGGRNFMFCSYHMERLGWLPEENSKTLERSERVYLWAINRPANGIQALYAESNNNLFHFEFRRQLGFDKRLEDDLVDGILVRTCQMGRGNPHIIDMTPGSSTRNDFLDAALGVGCTFKDDNLEVTTVEITDEYAVVDVVINGEVVSTDQQIDGRGTPLHNKRISFAVKSKGLQHIIDLPLNDAGKLRHVVIVDPAGHQIRKFVNPEKNLVWDGLTENGTKVGPGVYILLFGCDAATISATAVITR